MRVVAAVRPRECAVGGCMGVLVKVSMLALAQNLPESGGCCLEPRYVVGVWD